VLGLAQALIAKKLIDHLSAHDAMFGYVAISQGIMADLRWQLFDRLLADLAALHT
jgi:hypothetical protein